VPGLVGTTTFALSRDIGAEHPQPSTSTVISRRTQAEQLGPINQQFLRRTVKLALLIIAKAIRPGGSNTANDFHIRLLLGGIAAAGAEGHLHGMDNSALAAAPPLRQPGPDDQIASDHLGPSAFERH